MSKITKNIENSQMELKKNRKRYIFISVKRLSYSMGDKGNGINEGYLGSLWSISGYRQ